MTGKIKSRLLTNFFGPDYLTDERIQAGADKAGNYSYLLTMFLLWLAMIYGLLRHQIELAGISAIIFFISGIFYTRFRVKNGSFQDKKAKTKSRAILKWFFMGAIFASVMFLAQLRRIETFTSDNIYHLIIKCVVFTILWVFLCIFARRSLVRKNDNVLKKKMDETD